jgi:Asp-tRNA(Asn)/Glu-tRNA(Gln) amidotransferase A subunit family amidase
MARSILDVAAAIDAVMGPEPSDLASLPRAEASALAAVADPHLPIRVAWSPTLGYAEADAEVLAACERALGVIAGMGVEVEEIDGPFDADCVDEWLTIVGACLARSMDGQDGHPRWDEVDGVLKMIVDGGRATDAVTLVKALDTAHELNLRLIDLFHHDRLLLTPTMAGVAPPVELGGLGLVNGETEINWVRYTYPFNMTRSPAATVAVGVASSGVPIGMQIVGPQHADLAVLRAAAALEAALGFDAVATL